MCARVRGSDISETEEDPQAFQNFPNRSKPVKDVTLYGTEPSVVKTNDLTEHEKVAFCLSNADLDPQNTFMR
jgi:hypothetical protein